MEGWLKKEDRLKFKKTIRGHYEAKTTINGIDYIVIATIQDDGKAFQYDARRLSDDKYYYDHSLRLKDIKYQDWAMVINNIEEYGM